MQWSWARVDVRDAAREVSQAHTFREGDVYMTFPFLSHLKSKERRSHLIPARYTLLCSFGLFHNYSTNDKVGRAGICGAWFGFCACSTTKVPQFVFSYVPLKSRMSRARTARRNQTALLTCLTKLG